MKNLFNRTLSILCAVMLMISAVSAWAAAEEFATPTDLNPAEEEGIDSIEVIVTKTLTVGQSWDGKMKKTKPDVLKLDVTTPGLVYMLVEGRDVWATVEKSDRQTENPERSRTDPETGLMVISWEAEEGSYLITLGPVEPNLLAKATVSFMNSDAYETWEEEQANPEPEPDDEAEPEPDNKDAESEKAEEKKQESAINPQRSITVEVTTDEPEPVVGDTAHFRAILNGYDGLNYTMQWQYSNDRQTWHDIPEETNESMDVIVTPENNTVYWRILVYLEEEQKD